MKQKASDIIKRALHLADLTNTDFLTHWEQTQYINDAWKTVYQWLINKGDKQFIKEVSLGGANYGSITEYDIPDDLYQILSLKDGNSGRIIPRHAESESISSNTYEVINGKIRLYGVTATNLVLTYYMTPVWITYPDNTIDLTDLIKSGWVLCSTYGNRALFRTAVSERDPDTYKLNITYNVVNLLTGAIGEDIVFETETEPGSSNGQTAILGKGTVWVTGGGSLYESKLYDLNGVELDYYKASYTEDTKLPISNNSNCTAQRVNDYLRILEMNSITQNPRGMHSYRDTLSYPKAQDFALINWDGVDYLFGLNSSGQISWWDTTTAATDVYPEVLIEDKYNATSVHFMVTNDEVVIDIPGSNKRLRINKDFEISEEPTSKDYSLLGSVDYGFIVTDYTHTELQSSDEDTEFNFPNELYFSLIAADLAMRYLMKQNADSSGLQQLYQTMQQTFMNTLSQDGGYTRIKNIYRG